MDTDTYRYLMSALMQVFGALVALDAIFLVFQQQAMSALKTRLLLQIGRHVSLINRFKGISFSNTPGIVAETERDAEVFETFRHEDIVRDIITGLGNLDTRITFDETQAKETRAKADANPTMFGHAQRATKHEENVREATRTRTLLQHCAYQYKSIKQKEQTMPRQVTATMTVPAALVVLFAIALAPAGNVPLKYNTWLAIVAIALSAGTLVFLVYTARKIMIPPTTTTPHPTTGTPHPTD